MLSDYQLIASLATSDSQRARQWYSERLGLEPMFEMPGYLGYQVGPGMFTVYETEFAGTAKNTVAVMNVRDLDAEMRRLRSSGVVFEEYDIPNFKTVDGVSTDAEDGARNAWFKDPDGNGWTLQKLPY